MAVRNKSQGWDRLGDDQVGFFPFSDGTESIAYSHSVGGVDCAGVERLLWGETHADAAEGHHEAHIATWT